jgi:hypothetical protein
LDLDERWINAGNVIIAAYEGWVEIVLQREKNQTVYMIDSLPCHVFASSVSDVLEFDGK